MPLFDFRCQCGHEFETITKLNDDFSTIECPQCHAVGKSTKLIGPTNFRLKGTGWYETDFKNKPTGDTNE